MKSKILNNWGLKLGSLVIAALIWLVVAQTQNPQGKKTFNNIPVVFKNTNLLEEQGKVFQILDNTDTVRVTVWAPESNLNNIRSEDIIAEADMSKLTDINTIVINCYVQNVSYDTVKCSHDAVRLAIEEKKSKYVNLVYETVGEVADGYIVNSVTPDQNRIEVSGAKSGVEEVSYAKVVIDVTDASSNLSANVEIILCDENGEPLNLSNVHTNVGFVHMQVEVLQTKVVPVESDFMGLPAEGFAAVGQATVSPSEVIIAGTPTTLAAINKITIPAEEVNITGADTDMAVSVNLKQCTPDFIKIPDISGNGKVTVNVSIEPLGQKEVTIPSPRVTIINVPEGFAAEWKVNDELDIMLSGPESIINPLQSTSVSAVFDIAGWMADNNISELTAGEYDVPLDIISPEGLQINEEIYKKVIFTIAE